MRCIQTSCTQASNRGQQGLNVEASVGLLVHVPSNTASPNGCVLRTLFASALTPAENGRAKCCRPPPCHVLASCVLKKYIKTEEGLT